MFSKNIIKNLPNNSRFYIIAFSILISIFLVCWLRIQVVDDQLYYIQVQQTFGFLAVGFLYATLLISPVQKIVGKPEWMKKVVFTRRATGVSVFYFAMLHAIVSLFWQIGGWSGLIGLPDRFTWALIFSATALIILCVLAITSFDRVLIRMGFVRWKRLQRWVYISGILIIVHVWMIGAHFSTPGVQIAGFVALAILFGLQSWRMGSYLVERYHLSQVKKYFLAMAFWFVWLVFLGLISFTRPAQAHMFSKDTMVGSGAVLHITPDDDPVAGEKASLIFDVHDFSTGEVQASAMLIIADDRSRETAVPTQIQGTTVTAEYVFPQQGLYKITLSIEQDGRQTHRFMQSQRVNRGMISNATIESSAPLWAVVGAASTGAATIGIAGMAIVRRKAISDYSKL